MLRGSSGSYGGIESKQHCKMVTSFGFLATVVCPPFVREPGGWGLWAVVFIHKLSGHMKCVPGDSCQRPQRRPKHCHMNVNTSLNNFISIFWFMID